MAKNTLKELWRSKKTIYSFQELHQLWRDTSIKTIKSRLYHYTQKGDLYHIRRGLYALDKDYDKLEFATKIYIPSYISFETVLVSAGIVFQYYKRIFVATYQTRTLICDGQTYEFKKLKDEILTNNLGLENRETYWIASPERAVLDILYLNNDYYFDNLLGIKWDKLYEILPLYNNKRMEKVVDRQYQSFKDQL